MKKRTDQEFITSSYLNSLKDSRKRKRSFITICSALALIVASATVMEMIQPAAAETKTETVLDCHFPVHEHTEECYEILYDEEGNEIGKELICGQADFVAHQHTEECYKTVFNEETQSEEKVLVCDLPEIEPHVHTDSCYEERQVLICEEDHEHDETCYETEKVLTCDKIELHTHDESCYDEDGNLVCDKLEVLVHQHDDSCFKEIIVDDGTEEVPAEEEAQEEVVPSEPEPEIAEEDATETLIALNDTYRITVTYGKDAQIPENASLKVTEITKGFTKYEEYYAQVEGMLDSITEIQSIRIFDISIMAGDDPEELTPVEPHAPVDVRISYPYGLQMSDDDRIQVVHFTDSEPEVLTSDTKEKNDVVTDIIFTTESFSAFAAVKESITTQLADNTIAYFSFDNNTDGFTGAGATATKVGSPSSGPGHSGYALYLDGNTGTYLNVTGENGSLLTGLDEFTVSYWVKPTAGTSDGTHGNWAYYAAPTAGAANNRYIGVFHQNGGTQSERYNGSRPSYITVDGSVPVNEWHHVAVVYTQGGTNDNTVLYIDGNEVGSENSPVDLTDLLGNNSIFQIGRANWGNGEGFRGYIDEFSVFNYPLSKTEVNLLMESTGTVVLNPMNENGVLPGEPNVSSTHYKNMTIDGHLVYGTGSDQRNLEYARMYIPVTYDSKGKATVTLPSNSQLGNFKVSDADTVQHSITQDDNKYQWVLKGWVNIATGQYYDTRNGSVQVEVDHNKLNVFYADWEAANYDYTINMEDLADTKDTSDFVSIKVFDYSELFNLASSEAWQVDYDAHSFVPRSTWESEEWYIKQEGVNPGNYVQFVDNTDAANAWQYGTLGNTQGRRRRGSPESEQFWSSYSGTLPVEGIAGTWGNKIASTSVVYPLFSESNVPGSGVKYLGEATHLFQYNATEKKYYYDSNDNGAVYNQSEQRFYVADEAKTHTVFEWHQDGNHGTQVVTGFLPLNSYYDPLTYNNGTTNYWFGMKIEVAFWLPDTPGTENANQVVGQDGRARDMSFYFRGDDDVWVLIDDKVALDLGGIHERIEGSINFTTGVIRNPSSTHNLRDMGIGAGSHTLTFYYIERGANQSNAEITFNLVPRWIQPPANVKTAKVTKSWSEDTPEAERNTVEFSLEADGVPVPNTTKHFSDFVYEDEMWSYTWEYLEGGKEYDVVETAADDFEFEKTSETGTYGYWAIAGYNDDETYGKEPILLGSGSQHNGHLLNIVGASVPADIIYDVIVINNNEVLPDPETVKWQVEQSPTESQHFYLKNNNGQYLSIINGTIQLVNAADVNANKSNISLFYVGPTGDVNDANSANRLMIVESTGVITVGAKKGPESAGIESTDRIRIYAYQQFANNVVNYTITNKYKRFPIQFKKVSIEDVRVDSNGLEGAVFSLYDAAPDVNGNFNPAHRITTLISRTGGYLYADISSAVDADVAVTEGEKILNVHPGTYYLREDTCPTGYLRYADWFTFTVDNEGRLSFDYPDTMAESASYVAAVTETIDDKQVSVPTGLLPNARGAELPYTGGMGTYPYMIFGSILLLGAGILLWQKHRITIE